MLICFSEAYVHDGRVLRQQQQIHAMLDQIPLLLDKMPTPTKSPANPFTTGLCCVRNARHAQLQLIPLRCAGIVRKNYDLRTLESTRYLFSNKDPIPENLSNFYKHLLRQKSGNSIYMYVAETISHEICYVLKRST